MKLYWFLLNYTRKKPGFVLEQTRDGIEKGELWNMNKRGKLNHILNPDFLRINNVEINTIGIATSKYTIPLGINLL